MKSTCFLSTWLIISLFYSAAQAQQELPSIADYEISTSRERLIEDVTPTINTALAQLRDYHITDACSQVQEGLTCRRGPCIPVSGEGFPQRPYIFEASFSYDLARMMCTYIDVCDPNMVTRCAPSMGKLTVGGPLVVQDITRLVMSPPNKNEVPADYLALKESYRNCSPEKGQFTFTHNLEDEVGVLVRKQKSIKTGSSYTLGAKFSFKYTDLFGADFTGSMTISENITVTDLEDQNYREEKSYSFSLPVTVPSNHELTVTHEWIKRIVPVEYKGTAVLDGQISTNKEGITLISQVLSDEDMRHFDFNGILELALVFEGKTVVLTRELVASDCPPPVLQ